MGASFQASISALFFNTLLDILLTPSKLQALQRFAVKDPLLEAPGEPETDPASINIGQVSALAVIVLNLSVILLSMLLFAVSVRLSIHTGASLHNMHVTQCHSRRTYSGWRRPIGTAVSGWCGEFGTNNTGCCTQVTTTRRVDMRMLSYRFGML